MRKIVLCDNGEYAKTARLCEKYAKYGVGANVDALYDQDFLESHPEETEKHLEAYINTVICSMHGPFGDLCFGSFDRLIREATRKRFEYAYGVSRKLGCEHIILHHGYVPGTSSPPNWVKRSKAFWADFLRDKSPGTVFHLENFLERGPELLLEVITAIDDPRVDVCLDVGHVHCHAKTPPSEWIKALNRRIGFVHLHNNHGEKDEHLGFDNGTMDLRAVCGGLDEYAPGAIWAVETKEDAMENDLLWLIEKGFI